MNHSEGTFQGQQGTELYYQGWRPEGAPKANLAIVHGFGEHSGRYGNVVDWYVPRGYGVYAFDLRGHGRSPGKRGHVDSFAQVRDDVSAFLDRVRQAEPDCPLVLVGHSMGGLIVLHYVLYRPAGLAGVVASGPLLYPPEVPPLLWTISKLLSALVPSMVVREGLDATAISRDQAVVDAYVHDPLVHGKATARLGTEIAAAIDWTQAHAPELNLPLLIVHGTADRLCPAHASKTFFDHVGYADKERIEYPGYFHEVFNEPGKEQVLQDMERWIEQHTR